MVLEAVTGLNRKLRTQVRDSLRLAPVLTRKPKVLRLWLFRSHKLQVVILAVLLLLAFAILPALDALLSDIFRPVTQDALFGLIHTTVENPHLEPAQLTTHWFLWIAAALLVLYLYLRHLPVAVATARNIAREKEQLADKLVQTHPSESILLYDAARDWSCDEEAEAGILSKLQHLNARMSQGSGVSTVVSSTSSAPRADATMVLSGEAMQTRAQNAIIADRYRVKRQLGAGAMRIVYQAWDQTLNRDVALKQLAPALANDAQLLARFRQEALALARLSHPNIVQVYDFIEWQGLSLIVMEFVDGVELETRLRHASLLSLPDAISLARQMADALGYTHERGVVHRDFKPANVLISHQGEVKITDFGIAKLARSSVQTQMNTVMGSPAYMSPEQARGEPTDQRTDIYALGVVLYQLLSGKRPFEGDMETVIAQHLSKMPASLTSIRSDVPPALDEIVHKMLAKQPDARFQSMAEVIAQLGKH